MNKCHLYIYIYISRYVKKKYNEREREGMHIHYITLHHIKLHTYTIYTYIKLHEYALCWSAVKPFALESRRFQPLPGGKVPADARLVLESEDE